MSFETLLTTAETAEKLRIRRQTLEAWRMTGQGPRFIKMGRRVIYRLIDVEAHARANRGVRLADQPRTFQAMSCRTLFR